MSKQYLCPQSGCYGIVPESGRYCDRHKGLQAAKDERERARGAESWAKLHAKHESTGARSLYKDARWRKLRVSFIRANPTCATCGDKATEAHHRVRHNGREEVFFDASNLVPLCHRCHLDASRDERWEKQGTMPNPYPRAEKTEHMG
jgi:5-methylcytosine-specific restriction endonuclease McrA